MYITHNPYYTQNNFCPCCGRPMGYYPQPYNPWTPYCATSDSVQDTNIPVQNVKKKENNK